ncbi:MAG: SDR family NAD(P)-dependent oxidoreductase [bacterium]
MSAPAHDEDDQAQDPSPRPTREALARPTAADVFRAEAFRGRVYGITGAGHNIGEALARSMAQLEARLVLVDMNEARLKRVCDELRAGGADVREVIGDVGQRAVIERAVDTALQVWGRADGWVNNAPANVRPPIEKETDAEAEYVWRVNVEAARIAMQRLLPTMKAQGGGALLNVSSILAHQARGLDATYAGTKGALEAITRAWAVELGQWNIRVNCVQPGSTELPPREQRGTFERELYWTHARAHVPMPVPTLPRDVANAMLFLLSDAAAGITGVVLPVDSGSGVEYPHIEDPQRAAARRALPGLLDRLRDTSTT